MFEATGCLCVGNTAEFLIAGPCHCEETAFSGTTGLLFRDKAMLSKCKGDSNLDVDGYTKTKVTRVEIRVGTNCRLRPLARVAAGDKRRPTGIEECAVSFGGPAAMGDHIVMGPADDETCNYVVRDTCFHLVGRGVVTEGSAIFFYSDDSSMEVLRSQFHQCSCTGSGGAISARAWGLWYIDTVFDTCDCNAEGAAVTLTRPINAGRDQTRLHLYERVLVENCGRTTGTMGVLRWSYSTLPTEVKYSLQHVNMTGCGRVAGGMATVFKCDDAGTSCTEFWSVHIDFCTWFKCLGKSGVSVMNTEGKSWARDSSFVENTVTSEAWLTLPSYTLRNQPFPVLRCYFIDNI
jgi:hypothetical protein